MSNQRQEKPKDDLILVNNTPSPIVAVDVVVFTVVDNKLKVLLIKMKKSPFEANWAMPGGRISLEESLDEAAKRELFEKTGVKDVFLEQLYTFGEVKRDPFDRVVSVAYFALIDATNMALKTTEKYAGIDWFEIKNTPKLAYDHEDVLRYAVERLKSKLEYTNIVYSLLPPLFTLAELQKVYETVLDRKIDKRNFRKKILSLKLVKKTDKTTEKAAHRPAVLYEFNKREPEIVNVL